MQPAKLVLPNLSIGATHIAGLSCALCVVAVGYFGFHRHFASLRAETAERVGLVQAKLENGESIRRNYATQKKTLSELLARVEQVRQRVPVQAEEGEFLANVSRLARTHQIQINDFKRGASTANQDHSSTEVTVTGPGPTRIFAVSSKPSRNCPASPTSPR